MQVTLSLVDFKKLIVTSCALMEASELGREAIKGDNGPAFWLRTEDKQLYIEAAVRGMELQVKVDTLTCEEDGEIAINPFTLKRLAVKAPEVKLTGTAKTLEIKAGKLKTTIPALQTTKPVKYDAIDLSNQLPCKLISDSLLATNLVAAQETQPFTKLVWGKAGARIWTHNPFNASHTTIFDVEGEDFSTILPVSLVLAIASADPKQSIKIGTNGRAIRFQTPNIDVTHPIKMIEIEDIESAIQQMDKDTIPSFEIDAIQFSDSLNSVGSVDHKSSKTQQSGIDLWVMPKKSKLVLTTKTSAGESTIRVDVTKLNCITEPMNLKINFRQLCDFIGRSKGQLIRIGVLEDRMMVWAGPTTYMLAPIQEEQAEAA